MSSIYRKNNWIFIYFLEEFKSSKPQLMGILPYSLFYKITDQQVMLPKERYRQQSL
jgi:hypothetical protein